jgi:hypothetical protein
LSHNRLQIQCSAPHFNAHFHINPRRAGTGWPLPKKAQYALFETVTVRGTRGFPTRSKSHSRDRLWGRRFKTAFRDQHVPCEGMKAGDRQFTGAPFLKAGDFLQPLRSDESGWCRRH